MVHMEELATGVQQVLISPLLTSQCETSQLESIWGEIKLDSLDEGSRAQRGIAFAKRHTEVRLLNLVGAQVLWVIQGLAAPLPQA